jgi:type IV secretion system protein VirB4
MSTYPGQPENGHLKRVTGVGTPHVVCLSGTSRFDLSLAVGDVGHTLIVGPSGSGKTTLAGYMELLWLKYPRAKVIIYDVGRGARATTLAVGGAYYTPGAPDGGCAFQPLRCIDREPERIWAEQWLLEMLALRGVASHDAELAVEAVLHAMAANPDPRSRTMSEFVRILGTHHEQLGDAMRIYTLQGLFGRIFDGDDDPLGDSFWRCYEMKDMMKLKDRQDVFGPVMKYLAHRDEELVDGSPILKVKDECWRFWSDPGMAEDSRADVKTGRVRNIYNVYLTQELADFAADERLRSSMLTNTKTHIYLANPDAKVPELARYYAAFGLTPTEIALIAKATPCLDYFYRSPLGRRWFSLPIGPAALAFIGGTDDNDQRAMDAIVRERDPQDYALALLELQTSRPGGKGAQWAVDAFKTLRGDDVAA